MRSLSELNLNDGGEPINIASPTAYQIALVERLLGTRLPAPYIEFLNFSNGGHPELDTFIVEKEGYAWSVNNFFHITSNTESTEDTEDVIWNYHHRWPGAPREILPIARDGGGNLFCLDLTNEGKGRIVVQIHDESGFPFVTIADSFDMFIDALTVDPDDI